MSSITRQVRPNTIRAKVNTLGRFVLSSVTQRTGLYRSAHRLRLNDPTALSCDLYCIE